jgi:hypothetical protein
LEHIYSPNISHDVSIIGSSSRACNHVETVRRFASTPAVACCACTALVDHCDTNYCSEITEHRQCWNSNRFSYAVSIRGLASAHFAHRG